MAETFECPNCNIINEMHKVLTVTSKRQIICIDCKYKIKEKKKYILKCGHTICNKCFDYNIQLSLIKNIELYNGKKHHMMI